MARNDIRLDQIQARLGVMNKPRQYDGYDDLPDDDQYDEPRTFNAGFIASMLGLFLAVSGGTFYFSGTGNPLKGLSLASVIGGVPAGFVSKAEAACGGHWSKGGRNDNSIMCYLTTEVDRLCSPDERLHLASKMSQYRSDRSTFEVAAVAKGVKTVTGLQGALKQTFSEIQSNIDSFDSGSSSRHYNANEQAQRRNSRHSSGGYKEPGSALVAAFGGFKDLQQASTPDGQIAQAIRKLGAQGYLTKWDFGLMPDGLVVRAFSNMPDGLRNVCNR